MRKYSDLTKEMLQNYGITNITEDGRIFKGDVEIKQHITNKKGKYKDQAKYARIGVVDKSQKIYNDKYSKGWYCYKRIAIPVHRVVYAWYHGIVPVGYDVDHIDNNTLNNNLSNLQLLTREENNQKKVVSRNQYNYNMTDEEILEKRAKQKYIYDRNLHKVVKADWWIEAVKQKRQNRTAEIAEKKQAYQEWHRLLQENRDLQKERVQAKKDRDLPKWRELGRRIRENQIKILEIRGNQRIPSKIIGEIIREEENQ